MKFCPCCGTLLQVDADRAEAGLFFTCRCCAYRFEVPPEKPITEVVRVRPKKPSEISSGNDSRQTTEVNCEKCPNKKAFFHEMQTRSADEAATIFYQCTACGHTWKE